MNNLKTLNSVPCADGRMHLVELPEGFGNPDWLVNTQIELDGKRVFVRMIDTAIESNVESDRKLIGMVVSSVY
ncbi:MAG: hypothetical protein P8Y12_01525 [Gammaproteobacteria bacterium]